MPTKKSTTTPKPVKLTKYDLRDLQELADGALMFRDMFGILIGRMPTYRKSSVNRLNKFIKAGYVKIHRHTTMEDRFEITRAGRKVVS